MLALKNCVFDLGSRISENKSTYAIEQDFDKLSRFVIPTFCSPIDGSFVLYGFYVRSFKS